MVRPLADGKGAIRFRLADQTLTLPVTVTGQKKPFEVSFVRDVMPLMSRIGCNAGTCHGAKEGKNGFKLSLRGYDPFFDHQALTDDLEGRRFNRAAPDRSLMLLKPSGGVPHVGGVLMQPNDRSYHLLRDWIAAGVKIDLATPRVTSIDIFPEGTCDSAAQVEAADGRHRDLCRRQHARRQCRGIRGDQQRRRGHRRQTGTGHRGPVPTAGRSSARRKSATPMRACAVLIGCRFALAR